MIRYVVQLSNSTYADSISTSVSSIDEAFAFVYIDRAEELARLVNGKVVPIEVSYIPVSTLEKGVPLESESEGEVQMGYQVDGDKESSRVKILEDKVTSLSEELNRASKELDRFKRDYALFEECSPPDMPRGEFVKWCYQAWMDQDRKIDEVINEKDDFNLTEENVNGQ